LFDKLRAAEMKWIVEKARAFYRPGLISLPAGQ